MANVAIKDLDRVLELEPAEKEKVVAVHQTRGEILWKLGQKKESQEAFAQAVELDPENYEMMSTLGGRFLEDGELDNAAKYLTMSLDVQKNVNALDANDTDTYRVLGGVHVKQQKWDEALAAYNSALELRADDPGVIYDIAAARCKYGDSLEKVGKTDEANAQYTEGAKGITSLISSSDPKPEYYQVLAFCKSRLKDSAGAAIALKRAEELRKKTN
jgi:tetratricopeptide (TPR) repeat protein